MELDDIWFIPRMGKPQYRPAPADAIDRLYRAEWSRINEPGSILVRAYRVIKRTPRGAWIDRGWGETRFVNLHAKKQFASNTEAEAVKQMLHRAKRYLRILEARAQATRERLDGFSMSFLKGKREWR